MLTVSQTDRKGVLSERVSGFARRGFHLAFILDGRSSGSSLFEGNQTQDDDDIDEDDNYEEDNGSYETYY